jgi:hypothetical protein
VPGVRVTPGAPIFFKELSPLAVSRQEKAYPWLGRCIGGDIFMRQDFLALLAIVIAGVVAVGGQPGRFTLWETIIGFILFDLLLCIDLKGFITCFEKIAFCATAGFSLIIVFGFFIEELLDLSPYFVIPSGEEESGKRHLVFFCLWVLLSFIASFFIPVLQSYIARHNR